MTGIRMGCSLCISRDVNHWYRGVAAMGAATQRCAGWCPGPEVKARNQDVGRFTPCQMLPCRHPVVGDRYLISGLIERRLHLMRSTESVSAIKMRMKTLSPHGSRLMRRQSLLNVNNCK